MLVALICLTPYYMLRNTSFKEDEKKHILILGNSMTECAIDDKIFSQAINLSLSGDATPFSYFKLKKAVHSNPNIDTVILAYSGGLNKFSDNKWAQGFVLNSKMWTYSILIESFDDVRLLSEDINLFIGIIRSPLYQLKNCVKKLTNPEFNYKHLSIGGFKPLNWNTIAKRETPQAESFDFSIDTTTIQYQYLQKIQEFCVKKKIELILLFPPVYNVDDKSDRKLLYSNTKKHFPSLKFIDYSDFPLEKTSYADNVHLNREGATIFSKHLQENTISNTFSINHKEK